MIRKPAVAGLFYDSNPEKLKRNIESCFKHKLGPGNIPKLGISRNFDQFQNNDRSNSQYLNVYGSVVPHAGYVYSGPIAAHAYYSIVENGYPETFIILCPNHTGLGTGISIFDKGKWNTPLGDVEIDEEFAKNMVLNSNFIDSDTSAHVKEHSCEVHLPFLQYFSNDFKIVPIVMWMQDMETSEDIADSIVKTAKKLKRSISIIASTDLTHYEPKSIAEKKDKFILDAINNMDESALLNSIKTHRITMCGYGPTISTIRASRDLGAKKGEVLKYATSGDISGDLSSVVGYCSAIFVD
ncbi:AmmeMemoRadiSam system protein B [Methanobrevibacter sp. TMH8]|uniref:AmmeMemoRadiSam system protein B n=1 Tax=Methanobrevibacter sp. TMH8 TaxID=2848611 RepID=UPI001CCF79C6|nr:AmmeMemoRadiSam system protein B [Methanobrevibacter sp. TMH8]MBZ9571565.1 AmmeMemoRadiSam system protein B [Methanobrevibacter sp. TMH8]